MHLVILCLDQIILCLDRNLTAEQPRIPLTRFGACTSQNVSLSKRMQSYVYIDRAVHQHPSRLPRCNGVQRTHVVRSRGLGVAWHSTEQLFLKKCSQLQALYCSFERSLRYISSGLFSHKRCSFPVSPGASSENLELTQTA